MTTHLKTIILVLGVVFGIVIGERSLYATEIVVMTSVTFLVELFICLVSKKRGRVSFVSVIIILLSVGVALGIVRTQFVEEKGSIVCVSSCQVSGQVVRKGDTKDTHQVFDVQVEEGSLYVRVRMPLYPTYQVGDDLLLEGLIREPENLTPHNGEKTFDYGMYLYLHAVGSEMYYPKVTVIPSKEKSFKSTLQLFTASLVSRIDMHLKQPASYLASGMLLGVTNFSEELTERFRVAGLSHIVVLSGFNITILIVFVLFLLRPFPVTIRALAASVLVITFVVMVGGGSSLIRASAMSGIALLALLFGRGYVAHQALLVSFLLIVLYTPRSLLYDVSLHLSFLATSGIVYGYDVFEKYFDGRLPKSINELLSATLAAYIFTLPYTLYTFGVFSVYAVVANLLVLPLVPLTMSFTVLTLLLSFMSTPLSVVLGLIATFLSSCILFLASVVEDLPFAKVAVYISFETMLTMYLIIILLVLFLRTWKKNETAETKGEEIVSPIIRF